DQFADRVVLIDQGRVVADGSASSIRAATSGRTVSALISPRDAQAVAASSAVRSCVARGERHYFDTTDSDGLLRLLVGQPSATETEVAPRSLEEAFMAITAQGRTAQEGLR